MATDPNFIVANLHGDVSTIYLGLIRHGRFDHSGFKLLYLLLDVVSSRAEGRLIQTTNRLSLYRASAYAARLYGSESRPRAHRIWGPKLNQSGAGLQVTLITNMAASCDE